ncbi:hypothetical protein I6F35_02425 [Bradyrhizobium sp. BRP22]|uniref:hypothetical protein n=1 Tax=Bradyrhizobium sp. BRP22 TaxID=2793821 RepID=UPI001CD59665|nr:hypothetical protein [Bradyrhizobium sp. BRP22]MCA1452071.1 hypothetical protein [Bradyrhizobium sp. BRP22]
MNYENDALAIADLVGLDKETLTTSPLQAEHGIAKMVTAEVLMRYTLIDQLLGEIIATYFLNVEPLSIRYGSHASEQERVFYHHILDEMYLLRKLAIVHAANSVPPEVTSTINKLNAVRNALAHSFYPENRKEYRSSGKVTYSGLDIRTPAGLRKFINDTGAAINHLHELVYGPGL